MRQNCIVLCITIAIYAQARASFNILHDSNEKPNSCGKFLQLKTTPAKKKKNSYKSHCCTRRTKKSFAKRNETCTPENAAIIFAVNFTQSMFSMNESSCSNSILDKQF